MLFHIVHEWQQPLSELKNWNLAQYFSVLAMKAMAEGPGNSSEEEKRSEVNKPGDLARMVADLKAPKIVK